MSARVAVVGGGLVGMATAHRLLLDRPELRVTVLEKEGALARHQSGRNSGVLHSGLYYRPGSLKAKTCLAGRAAMTAFCEEEGIPLDRCGKVVVAVTEAELDRLGGLAERARENGVRVERVDSRGLSEIEPAAAGLAALHVPDAAVVDFPEACRRLAERFVEKGGEIRLGEGLHGLKREGKTLVLSTARERLEVDYLVNCAGLFSDRIARWAGLRPEVSILPFRGEYHVLTESAAELCRGLIYPVPDERFPFLGVHLTRSVHGEVEVGPNAVLATAREGYRRRDLRGRDLVEAVGFPGTWRLAGRHWRPGLVEVARSLSKRAFLAAARRLVPRLTLGDLRRAPAGVRAQAVRRDGRLEDDFLLVDGEREVHALNVPSPAATASLEIGRVIAERLERRLDDC
ncbi:MAG: L-2-hydroxyglutarate oxidase [Acidobacteriota bacterium]